MNFTIDINVTGMDKLAEAILALAGKGCGCHAGTPDKPAQVPAPVPSAPAVATQVPAPAPAPAPAVPVSPAPAAPAEPAPASAAPVAQPVYTFEQLQTAAGSLVTAGRQADLLALLAKFGVQAMTQLAPAQYGAFATALRELGAKL